MSLQELLPDILRHHVLSQRHLDCASLYAAHFVCRAFARYASVPNLLDSPDASLYQCAARHGYISLLSWMRSMLYPKEQPLVAAIGAGHGLTVLTWAESENLAPWNSSFWGKLCPAAARRGDLELLKWLRLRDVVWDDPDAVGEGLGDFAFAVGTGGNVALLEWVLGSSNSGLENIIGVSKAAALAGHGAMLEWLQERQLLRSMSPVQQGCAEGGHLSLLQWLCELHPPENPATIAVAAARGARLHVLEWLCDRYGPVVCVGPRTATAAAAAGSAALPVLQWCVRLLTDVDLLDAFCLAVPGGHLELLQWMYAQQGDELLRRAIAQPLMHLYLSAAADWGHLAALRVGDSAVVLISCGRLPYLSTLPLPYASRNATCCSLRQFVSSVC
jgi:hypothetical protein